MKGISLGSNITPGHNWATGLMGKSNSAFNIEEILTIEHKISCCDYCGDAKVKGIRLESDNSERTICVDCIIKIMDNTLGITRLIASKI